MTKRILSGLSLLLVLFLLTACGGGKLPSGMDEDTLISNSQTALTYLNNRDYASLNELFYEDSLTEEDWVEMMDPLLDAYGGFDSFGNTMMDTVKEDDVEYVQVYTVCEYENYSITYGLTYRDDYALLGLFVMAGVEK